MKKNIKINRIKLASAIVTFAILFGILLFNVDLDSFIGYTIDDLIKEEQEYINSDSLKNIDEESNDLLKVYFLDIGQGDSIIISKGSESMIIDAGPNSSENKLLKYINELGITKFKYVVGTHIHEDHIGGMEKIISNYDILKVIFPKTTSTTKTFSDFIDSVKAKGLSLTTPKVGEIYYLSDDVRIEIVAPNSEYYDDQNNYSVVIKVSYNNVSFLFTGDAESLSEKEILNNGIDISANVLKVGHHGSTTSTSSKFLDKVNPKYAIISVGAGNSYNHPHQEIITRLSIRNIIVYRTDMLGTIIAKTDGKSLNFEFERGN